jgi:hypothetical protein
VASSLQESNVAALVLAQLGPSFQSPKVWVEEMPTEFSRFRVFFCNFRIQFLSIFFVLTLNQ